MVLKQKATGKKSIPSGERYYLSVLLDRGEPHPAKRAHVRATSSAYLQYACTVLDTKSMYTFDTDISSTRQFYPPLL